MPTAIVLGAGLVGSVIAADLAADPDYSVTIADSRPDALERANARARGRLTTVRADLADAAVLRKTIAPYDVVVGALASAIGFQTLRVVIEAGKNYSDISFMPEDAIDLDELAKERGVTAVVDCGVAPGMSNLLAARAAAELDRADSIEIYVGGLPRERRWPFQYKAGFSPSDVVEEYTRPARIVERGEIVTRPALSEPELLEFDGVGTLEAFNTDGLRSLASTMKIPSMKEKTLRYPGHIELMRIFRETGLFSREPIDVPNPDDPRAGAVRVRPLDVISSLMFPKWTYGPAEEDLTVMRIIVDGVKSAKRVRHTWDLLEFYDRETRATSMSRTTAFPCAILARLLAAGTLTKPGVVPPELLGPDKPLVDAVLAEHHKRGVEYRHHVAPIDA
ncbi:MAG TPA: saccharopine dehydrogenase C-terminal domain-containing protein [Phycisphaerales bacterium]|nr:saccharopine dehydrogenase C-terminal domain-containing protein [Phycisphaerales bacterium]